MTILYLHGLGSSPASGKAEVVEKTFAPSGARVVAPDLNIPSFANLSVYAALACVEDELRAASEEGPILLIGSSFGAFLAVHAFHRSAPQVKKRIASLVLLAPALDPWFEGGGLLTKERDALWKSKGRLPLYHHTRQEEILVHYDFVRELSEVGRPQGLDAVPTLIVHGIKDRIVPVEVSHQFAEGSSNVIVREVEEEHDLLGDTDGLTALLLEGAVPYLSEAREK